MDFHNAYHAAVTVNCITIVHMCMHRMDRVPDRRLFLSVVLLTISRLAMDILFRHTNELYRMILGFFLVLEFLLLDCVVRKMQKLGSSPSIVIVLLSLCMIFADISYSMHLLHHSRTGKTHVVPVPVHADGV